MYYTVWYNNLCCDLSRVCVCVQSVKILTYREPQNPEYKEFVSQLKIDAGDKFNFTIDDSLVRLGDEGRDGGRESG